MSSWFSSWFPAFPSISNLSLPSSIQRRFISFVLKRSLGHLLKPGQLDIQQIDSQIGSGYVQVSNLELDGQAINGLLSQSDLPLELEDGTIASVTARIPWPNPLTSSLGFSLTSLHLILRVVPVSRPTFTPNLNLSDSVASYAESFIHDELDPPEEAILAESLRNDFTSEIDNNLPGGLDPFVNPSEETDMSDVDPDGVSVFATLIERLLAKFEFDAADTKISIIHSGCSRLTLSIADVRYRTETGTASGSAGVPNEAAGEVRTLSISGVSVSVCDLQPPHINIPSHSPSSSELASPYHDLQSSPRTPRSPSPASSSSSSSMDENAQWAMSQSLAFLPPRSASPTGSIASSLYQSAISTTQEPVGLNKNGEHSSSSGNNQPITSPSITSPSIHPEAPALSGGDDEKEKEEEMFLSFGSDPILVRLTTPPVRSRSQGNPSTDKVELSVDTGILSCALRSWHIRSLIRLADACMMTQAKENSPPSEPSSSRSSNFGGRKQLSVNVRGIALLLLGASDTTSPVSALTKQFFSSPLIPPLLPEGYVRILLEHIAFSVGFPSSSATLSDATKARSSQNTSPAASFLLSLSELSVFAFCASNKSTSNDGELLAFPVIITDPLLPTQYSSTHTHPRIMAAPDSFTLPVIDVMDWTDERVNKNGMKISMWRTKQKQGKATHVGDTSQGSRSAAEERRRDEAYYTLLIKGERTNPSTSFSPRGAKVLKDEVEIRLAPLHVFVDLTRVVGGGSVMAFLNDVTDAFNSTTQQKARQGREEHVAEEEDAGETPPATPRASTHITTAWERETERARLEQLVLKDLDLGFDYRQKVGSPREARNAAKPDAAEKLHRNRRKEHKLNIFFTFPAIRLEVRCSSQGQPSRSGALVVDIHDLSLSYGDMPEVPKKKVVTIEDSFSRQIPEVSAGNLLLSAGFRRIAVAVSPAVNDKADIVLSVSALDHETLEVDEARLDVDSSHPPLKPGFAVTKTNPNAALSSTVALSLSLPSLVVLVDKCALDSLQYWADDVSKLAQEMFNEAYDNGSNDTSLIGSRYFAKSRSGSGVASTVTGRSVDVKTDFVVKALVAEVFCRVMLPRLSEGPVVVRPFDIAASDVDVLVEVKPEGKEETVFTLGVMHLDARNSTASGSWETLLSLTASHNLLATPKPMVKLRFTSLVIPETTSKESRIRLSLWGFTYNFVPDISWMTDLGAFASAPPGAFETVVPSECTRVSLKIMDGSVKVTAPTHPGSVVLHMGDIDFSVNLIGNSPDLTFLLAVHACTLLAIDDLSDVIAGETMTGEDFHFWRKRGFALLAEISELVLKFQGIKDTKSPDTQVLIDQLCLRLHLCADTMAAVTSFVADLTTAFTSEEQTPVPKRRPTVISEERSDVGSIMSSVDDHAFKRVPEVGPAPDMIFDNLPRNPDYLDEYGAAAGFRELRDEDLDDFDDEEVYPVSHDEGPEGVVSRVGGETIRMLRPEGLRVVDNYFDNLPGDATDSSSETGETSLKILAHKTDINVFLYDGYDWTSTRRTIESEVREMRKRLAKIRQLVASGQTQECSTEETSALLFNSVYIGLEQDADELEPGALIAAIDEELKDDLETSSQSSWQSLRTPGSAKTPAPATRVNIKRLTRARGPSIEFRLLQIDAEIAQYRPNEPLVSRVFATVKDLEILDHIKTSTWKKFLTELRSDSRGNIRETDSNMVKIELRTLHPVADHPSEEARLKAKILPLRLHVDQDALDFLKKFFSFKDPNASPSPSANPDEGIYFQLAEIFPIDLKLDYKPRRVDYRALREGKTIELMNFFHFDGAEMTLRHIVLAGITGWPRVFDLLNDLWTPDVKATQLVDVISGVAPIRSMVNVGSGIADLVLLPIAQYKKDGRIVRGVQKGTTAFVKSTAVEAIKLGAKLATGTQVILEQAEGILDNQFKYPITAETLPHADEFSDHGLPSSDEEENADLISKYAEQPNSVKEGVQFAYRSLQKNFNSAAQTILAVPMEVYERSGNEGPVRSVIRAVPIAVLKPMIGASEAVSKTLLGLHNTLDPNLRHENDAKYKHR